MLQNRPVAFFDSGIGGLTAVSDFLDLLPGEDILYFADEASMPYGNKSFEEILENLLWGISFLKEFDPKLLVVACGTASSVLSLEETEIEKTIYCPVLKVINPACGAANKITRNKRVGVIATKATIETHSYRDALLNMNPCLEVFEKDCPELASIIEGKLATGLTLYDINYKIKGFTKGFLNIKNSEFGTNFLEGENIQLLDEKQPLFFDDKNKSTVNDYLTFFKDKNIDVLILGCTHYPLIKDYIFNILKEKVSIVSASKEVAKEASDILIREKFALKRGESGNFTAYTTGKEETFYKKAKIILREKSFKSFAVKNINKNDFGKNKGVNLTYDYFYRYVFKNKILTKTKS